MATAAGHCHIVSDSGILGGEPIIRGTRTPVRAVVETWRLGVSAEEIPRSLPHLTLAQVFDALSYYSDHQDEVNAYIERNRIPESTIDPLVANFLKPVFIRLYLDEDVNVLLADLLRARGFGVTTTREAGQMGKSDEEQLAFATSRGQAILTHKRVDFEALARKYFEEGRLHAGMVIAVRRRPTELLSRVLVLLNHVTADEVENQIRYI